MNGNHQSITDIEVIEAPWNKQITAQEVVYEGGFKMVRLRIKEGKRFTDLELDSENALKLGKLLNDWASANPAK